MVELFFLPVLIGIIFGFLLFCFTFIASKRSGKRYLAAVVTFSAGPIAFMYGLFFIGGFEGMAYGLLGIGFVVTAIAGTVFIRFLSHHDDRKKERSRRDKWSLFLLPLISIGLIGSIIYFDKNYWVIEEGTIPSSETSSQGYTVSTILEGRKMVSIRLGEEYEGKRIEVKKVTKFSSTTIVLNITEEGKPNELPYIEIGIDEIKEPLRVETTDGMVIVSDEIK